MINHFRFFVQVTAMSNIDCPRVKWIFNWQSFCRFWSLQI